jgi:hypothetical protein
MKEPNGAKGKMASELPTVESVSCGTWHLVWEL